MASASIVSCDASQTALGACLTQVGLDGKKTLHFNICLLNKLSGCEHPAAVATKAFSVAERQYSASQLEARR